MSQPRSATVQWPDVTHIEGCDFTEVINKALACPSLPENPGQEILTGFGHNAVLGVAEKIIAVALAGAFECGVNDLPLSG